MAEKSKDYGSSKTKDKKNRKGQAVDTSVYSACPSWLIGP
jgi:hypothetical protein